MRRSGNSADRVIWRSVNALDDGDSQLYLHADGIVACTRNAVTLDAGATVSYGSYFGAFPSGYWRHSTNLLAVELDFDVDGIADVSVFCTNDDGVVALVSSRERVAGVTSFAIELSEFTDGWIWPEFRARGSDVTISNITWRSRQPPLREQTMTVSITTFNREPDCVELLRTLSAPELMAVVRRVVVADQGSRSLRASNGFADAASRLGDRLGVIEQANLGGSGGFSRGMIAAAGGDDEFVLLLDDDVRLEPESLARLAAFASHTVRPTIIGAQMLSLVEPLKLHSFGERIERRTMWWSAVNPCLSQIDLGPGIRGIPLLSRRIDVDFNGWWMCLVPTALVRDVGASLPYFIKWDDGEFGLRASAHGVPTVTLPGAALWHMPWTAKDDGLDWQAYFQLRNRVLTALLHGRRGVLRSSFAQDVNHVLCAQYGSAALRNTALRDILIGPPHLDPVLRAGPARAAKVLARMGQSVLPVIDLAQTSDSRATAPKGLLAVAGRFARVAIHQLRRARADAPLAPLARLSRADGKWWSLGLIDAAAVDAASGDGVFVFRRDRATASRELCGAIALRWRIWLRWGRLARAYRASAAELASEAAWGARFAAGTTTAA